MRPPTPPPGAPRAKNRAWRVAALGGMASYIDAATIVSTGTALVLFEPVLELSPWTVGALSSLLTLSLAVGALVGGRLGDRFGRRRVFMIVLAVLAAGLALLAASVSVPMLYAGVVITGFAMGADIPTSLALIAEEAPADRRGRMVAFSQVLWIAGLAAAQIASHLVSDMGELGARLLYLHIFAVAVVVLILRSRLGESHQWSEANRERDTVVSDTDTDSAVRRDSLRRLLSRPLLAAVIATGLFYGIGNLAANTMGQFQTFLFVNVAGAEVSTATLVGVLVLPLSLGGNLLFMRIVDTRARIHWFALGSVLMVGGPLIPLLMGISLPTLATMAFALGAGGAFMGEGIYKVWSQELFPTLVRGSAQGITIAFTRVLAAGFALVTPVIAVASPLLLLALLSAVSLIAALIGGLWVHRLPKAVDEDALSVNDTPSIKETK